GLLDLYEATFTPRWVKAAVEIAETMVAQFWDEAEGGFFFTGRDHEVLLARAKDANDSSTPSGNGVAVTALLRLARRTGREKSRHKAVARLDRFKGVIVHAPRAGGQMLLALDFEIGPVQEVAVVGDVANEETRQVLRLLRRVFRPSAVLAQKPAAG